MATANSWSSDIPAKETKGGTGNDTYVTGDILYAGSANNLDRLGIGANNTVLTSNGTIPSWAPNPAGGPGSLTLLNSSTVSNVASVEWGNTIITATFTEYLFRWRDVITDNAATVDILAFQLSSDNGATWITTTSRNNWGSSQNNTANQGSEMFVGNIDNLVATGGIGSGTLRNPANANTYTTWNSQHQNGYTNNVTQGVWRWGASSPRDDEPQVAHNAFRFIGANAGNISGTFEVYGVTW